MAAGAGARRGLANGRVVAENIAVIGGGYVGAVVSACLAHVGHEVIGVERDPRRLASLRAGRAPLREPGLDELLSGSLEAGRLSFTDDLALGIDRSTMLFVCVGTPPGRDGRPDMAAMAEVVGRMAGRLRDGHVMVVKSTVPIGTGRWLRSLVEERLGDDARRCSFGIVSNPEFLREGRAVDDFLHPDRIVVGGDDPAARGRVVEVYAPIAAQRIPGDTEHRWPVPVVQSDLVTSEMIKYASNAFLATKISFVNEIARLCDLVGADASVVAGGMGLDSRIGRRFLDAGLGWGGSCLGKDLSALVGTAVELGYRPSLLDAARRVNERQRQLVVEALDRHLGALRGARLGLLGLAFKPGTDDTRDAPGLDIAQRLLRRGAAVSAFDPVVRSLPEGHGIRVAEDAYAAARDADALLLATEWPDFAALDLRRLRTVMRGDLLFDGRNFFDPERLRAAGFRYLGIGRPGVGSAAEPSAGLVPRAAG